MISEMWGAHGGIMYYSQTNWVGFYKVLGLGGVDKVKANEIPEGAVCLIRDGRWTGNMITDRFQ